MRMTWSRGHRTIWSWLRIYWAVLQVAAFCCIGSIPARACSCVDSSKSEAESIKSSFKWATAVFVATPVEVTIQQHELKFGNRTIPYQNYHVRLAVKEVFKGIATRYAVSDTGGPSDCSYGKMEIGHDYLIYATMSGDSNVGATAHTCFRLKTGSETGSGLPGN